MNRELIESVVPRWSQLNRIGQSRVLRSSYVWLFAVPLAAKFLAFVERQIFIPLLDYTLDLGVGLPFSWKVFYFSAVSFAAASALYAVGCPRIVSQYDRFGQWTAEGRGSRQIVREFLSELFRPKFIYYHRQEEQLEHFARTFRTTLPRSISFPESTTSHIDRRAVFEIDLPPEQLSEAFWYVRDFADNQRVLLRALATFFYAIGFLLIGVVAFQNLIFVWRMSF